MTEDADDAAKLAGLPGVRGVYAVTQVEQPAEKLDVQPLVNEARAMTGADVANQELGYTGAGIKVGMIDSAGGDIPVVALHLAYPVSGLYLDVYRANPDGTKGEKVHSNFLNYATQSDLGRFSALSTIAWDGTYQGKRGNNGKGNQKP